MPFPNPNTPAELTECTCCHDEVAAVTTVGRHSLCTDCAEDNTFTCQSCSDVNHNDDMCSVGDEVWCDSCADENAFYCDNCETTQPDEGSRSVRRHGADTHIWCASCVDSDAHVCARRQCGQLVPSESTVTVDGNEWCQGCYEDHSSLCTNCDENTDNNSIVYRNDECYCTDCDPGPDADDTDTDDADDTDSNRGFHNARRGTNNGSNTMQINRYHGTAAAGFRPILKPYPYCPPVSVEIPEKRCTNPDCLCGAILQEHEIITKRPQLLFGIELEIEATGDLTPVGIASRVKDQIGDLLAGAENDGSLRNGVECITQPATVDAHRAAWLKLDMRNTGAKSHDVDTCGMHVHCTRDAVSAHTWAKVVHVLGRKADEDKWSAIFRRAPNSYAKACTKRRMSSWNDHGGERYSVVNTMPAKTVEIRWPKGTLRGETIIATVETIHALLRYCESHGGQAALCFESFVTWCCLDPWARSETKVARAYFASKGLIDDKKDRALRPRKQPAIGCAPTTTSDY